MPPRTLFVGSRERSPRRGTARARHPPRIASTIPPRVGARVTTEPVASSSSRSRLEHAGRSSSPWAWAQQNTSFQRSDPIGAPTAADHAPGCARLRPAFRRSRGRMPLLAFIDGTPLAEAEARALWQRFSAWMEEHAGDLAGFARVGGVFERAPRAPRRRARARREPDCAAATVHQRSHQAGPERARVLSRKAPSLPPIGSSAAAEQRNERTSPAVGAQR